MSDTDTIIACEERLMQAVRRSDVAALDALLAEDATFIDQHGAQLAKSADLAAHASGLLAIDRLDVTDRAVRVLGDAAVVTCATGIAGRYDGEPFAGRYAYTRVWNRTDAGWRVAAAHCSAVAD